MNHFTVNADASAPSFLDAQTLATPQIFAGAGLVINVFLLDNGEDDIATAIDELVMEIKPARSDRPDGVPEVGDPVILRKTLASLTPETLLSNTGSGYHVQFTLSAAETVLGLWDRVFVSIYGSVSETTKIWAAGFAQVKKYISLPGIVDPLLALDRHHAMLKIEDGNALIYYWNAATGNLDVAPILVAGLVGPSAITGLSTAGNNFYVGTNGAGEPGIYSLEGFMLSENFTGAGMTPVNLASAVVGTPGNLHYYGTNAAGAKGFYPLPSPTKVLASAAIATHTDSATWTQKIASTASIVSGQLYKITISYGWNHDADTNDFIARATIGGVAIGSESAVIHQQEPKDAESGTDVTGAGTDQRHRYTGVFLWTAPTSNATAAVILDFSTTSNGIKSTMWDAVFIIEAF